MGGDSTGGGVMDVGSGRPPKTAAIPTAIQVTSPCAASRRNLSPAGFAGTPFLTSRSKDRACYPAARFTAGRVVIGQKINNYEVRSLLGEGGMGSVYVAEHPVLGRRAAVKVLRQEYAVDASLVGRFINEARASSAIKHPGIIEVFDVGTLAEGVPYLMMELLEGETLGRRIEREAR